MAEDEKGKSKAQEEEDFRAEQRNLALSQNQVGPNAVPEQRPIASQQRLDLHQSKSYLRRRAEGTLPVQEEPMGKDAYDRAASASQANKAAKDSRVPRYIVGQRVLVVNGPCAGSKGHIQAVRFKNLAAAAVANSGDPSESRFAEVESYTVLLRGGRPEILTLQPEDVQPVKTADFERSTI